MDIEFTATEAGFDKGLGGASNSNATVAYHYILFGRQEDPQHAWNRGVYFEVDSQRRGAANQVMKVVVGEGSVRFQLRANEFVTVNNGVDAQSWTKFMTGIDEVFGNLVERGS